MEVLLSRESVLEDILSERCAQVDKFGEQNHEDFRWATILGEEVGEACKEVMDLYLVRDDLEMVALRKELVQVAAVAVAWLEHIDRRANAYR